MNKIFKSRIFQKQFLSFILIIGVTFISISALLLIITKMSLEKQQLFTVEKYKNETTTTLSRWLNDQEDKIKTQAEYISKFGGDDIESAEMTKLLQKSLEWDKNFLNIVIGDNNGNVINSVAGQDALYNLSDRDYFQNAMVGKPTITGFLKGKKTGTSVMIIAEPILLKNGKTFILVGVISIDRVKEIINEVELKEIGRVSIVDNSGHFISSQNNTKEPSLNYNDKGFDTVAVTNVRNKINGTAIYNDFTGKLVFGSYEWMDALNIGVIVEFKKIVVLKPIAELLQAVGVITIVIFIFGTILAYIIAKNITKPIDIVITEIDAMAKSIFSRTIPTDLKNRNDEFGKLGMALEKMNMQTNSLINDLESSHEDIKASLEELVATEEELKEQNHQLIESKRNLMASEEWNNAIINVLPDIIFILDQNGRFINCQANDQNELVMPKEGFMGKLLGEIMPLKIANIGYEKIRRAIETGELQRFEYELKLNGERALFELRIVKSQFNEVIAIARNITEQHLYQERIEYLSYHDQLTGLYNRRFFEEELNRLDVEMNLPLCIIMADVNGLKLINDSFGHKIGDLLLVKVAEVLKRACRSDEIISRIGGDEFVILLPRMKPDQAEKLIQRIKFISDKETIASVNLSISFGWEAKLEQNEDIQEIFNQAENYMYKRKLFEGPSMRGKTIGAIINTLHEKNSREEQHSHRVAELCKQLATVSKLSEREIEEINNAGLLHDIGKIAIQDTLLNKAGKLTAEEFEEVRRHPEIGYRILSSVNDMAEIAEYVLSHHERWDGKGYPRGLVGEDIPLQARMISIADAFDAMTSERSYRSPMSETEASVELMRNSGTQFDPTLVHRFVNELLVNSNQ